LLAWLGWNVKIVRLRKEIRQWVAQHHGAFSPEGSIFTLEQRRLDGEIPWIRRKLGDRAAVAIELPPLTVTLEELHTIESAFPEAYVCIGAPDGPEAVPPLRPDGVVIYHWPPPPAPQPE